MAVDLRDGRRDILIACEKPTRVTVNSQIEFQGMFGWVRLQGDTVLSMRLIRGTRLRCNGVTLTAEQAEYQGTVRAIDTANPADNRVVLDPPLPPDASLKGRVIHFRNDLPLDTSYDIRAVLEDGISTGDCTLVRGLKSHTDFTAGFTYLVNPGDRYIVPTIVALDREP